MHDGWKVRREYELEHTRLIMSAVYSSAFGATKAVKPQNIFPLEEIDRRHVPQVSQESMDAFIKRMSAMEVKAGRLKPGQLIQLQKLTQE